MQIALDGSDLAAERFEGPSVYAGELLPRLSKLLHERGHTVVTYAPGPPQGVTITGDLRVIPGKPFWTQRIFASALRRHPPDVVFLPIQMLPLRRPPHMASVVVVHDLEFLHYPRTYTLGNLLLLRLFTKQAVRHATRIVAVSQYTKSDVVRAYGRQASEITVVHHGVAPESFRAPRAPEIRRRYQLPEHFILFVGALQPRKNIEGLVTAFEELSHTRVPAPAPQDPAHLVLACGGGWKEERILARIRRSAARDRIRLFRRLSPRDLTGLYQAARAFVLPSFSEGFGLPALEAMAAGTPVVVSATSSLPEIAGDAAVFVDPEDPKAIAHALARVLTDVSLRQELVRKGYDRANQFTWERTAGQTAAVIEEAGRARGT